MRRRSLAVALAIVVAVGAVALARADQPIGKPQATCPVSGQPIDKSVHVDYQGQRIYFCCPKCPAEFRKDPEKYFATFQAEGVQLENIQTTCPVSDEKLGEGGDMGPPVTLAYKGRTIKFCCKMCIGKFEKDPAKYLAKLPGEQPPAK
jgi:YHS domain-containing protein